MAQQLDFDIESLIDEATLAAAGPWGGAPLFYTAQYHTPAELEEAFERYVLENGRFGCYVESHMWHPAIASRPLSVASHELHVLNASTHCPYDDHDHEDLTQLGGAQANCPACRWHAIDHDENTVIEAWHDHAMPGWRDLPTLPAGLSAKRQQTWLQENYPPDWQFVGAPVLTLRSPNCTRHVDGRSPFGGYDLCIGTATEDDSTAMS